MVEEVLLNGYKIYPFDSKDHFLDHLENGNFGNILVALNAEKLVKEDRELKVLVNNNIGYPDGIGAVWALKRKGHNSEKIPGAEFWLDIIQRHYNDKTFYLVGGKPEVIEQTVDRLKEEYRGIDIVGYCNGYMDSQEQEKLIEDINTKEPDIVFVAMGSPKQEFVMEKMKRKHPALYMGLGGSFDIYSGRKERAPKILRKMGLEWSYRLFKEPRRIFRQTSLITFFYKLVTNKL
ncbi:WecB/TagA/CpsF family glycosyltransferase [Fodinibius saliphilus]|uniref:WecB/TagA/CpsF family glycosyltransferase n=1 Tax=Fodinibius saliphilus TaxID=1920650 RepID=UPI001109D36A|nr:WecB/TagA/CpsF family glycosyltransferase [Fodinibius saliphilus]